MCKVRNVRLSAIYDTISNLLRENQDIKNLKDIKEWFANVFPQIQPGEIVDALVATSPKQVDAAKNELKRRRDEIKRQAKIVNRLNELVTGINTQPITRTIPPKTEAQEMGELLKSLQRSISAVDGLTNVELMEALNSIDQLQRFYSQIYGAPLDVSAQAKLRIVDTIKKLQVLLKVKRLDQSISRLEEKIDNLSNGNIDVDAIVDSGVSEVFIPIDDAILEKELELRVTRQKFERAARKAQYSAVAKSKGFIGNKSAFGVKLRHIQEIIVSEGWEALRSIKFMADMSATGVQLLPAIQSELADVLFRGLIAGQVVKLTDPQKAKLYRDQGVESIKTIWKTISDAQAMIYLDAIRRIPQEGKKLLSKSERASAFTGTKGKRARAMLKQIETHHLFPAMKTAGLQISEGRSLTNSEEVFTSDLINKVPIFGAVKDISEDAMVTAINLQRSSMFIQFYEANPLATKEELAKVAQFINELTGTVEASQVTQGLSFFMSAPRLLASRLRLLFVRPITSVRNMIADPRSSANRYVARKMAGMIASYAGWIALLGMLPGIDFEDDPDQKDYMRVKFRGVVADFTGGLGSIMRMAAKLSIIKFGVDEDADFNAKNFEGKLTGFGSKSEMETLLQHLVGYRTHPAISSALGIWTGKDFFGMPLSDNGTEATFIATANAMLPILGENMYEEFRDDSPFTTDDKIVMGLNFFGINSYASGSAAQTPKVTEYLNKIEYKPITKRPTELTSLPDSDGKEMLKSIYRDKFGDLQGDIIDIYGADLTKGEFISKLEAANTILKRQFLEEYAEDIKELKKEGVSE